MGYTGKHAVPQAVGINILTMEKGRVQLQRSTAQVVIQCAYPQDTYLGRYLGSNQGRHLNNPLLAKI